MQPVAIEMSGLIWWDCVRRLVPWLRRKRHVGADRSLFNNHRDVLAQGKGSL
jgi:hypothetical protein